MSSERWVESPRLQTHLEWLLEQLEPHTEAIRTLIADGIKVDFFCYSYGSAERLPPLPRSIVDRSANLGIEIVIDHYVDQDGKQTV